MPALVPFEKELLQQMRPFKYVTLSELDFVLTYSKEIIFYPGDVVIQQGKNSTGMYVILEGNAIAHARVLGKGTVELVDLNVGDFAGSISLIENDVYNITVTATTTLKCLYVAKEYFDSFEIFYPEIKYKILQGIIENVCAQIITLCNKTLELMANIASATWFSMEEIIRYLAFPKLIDFEELNLNKNLFKNLDIFKDFSANEFEILLAKSKLVKATKGTIIINQQVPRSPFYIVVYGAIEADLNCDKKRAKLMVLGPEGLFGNLQCLKNDLSVNYSARENAVLLMFTEEMLASLQSENINLWYKFFNLICKSIVHVERAAEQLYVRLNSELYNR